MKEVQTDQLLTKITDPTLYPVVIHGTYFKFWNLIKAGGLKRMSRNHIHFAPGMPKQDGVISGMRTSCDIYIKIDMFEAIKDGIPFYISSNNVILTEGIDGVLPPKYFKAVTSRKGEDMLQREIQKMEKNEKEEEEEKPAHKKNDKGEKKQKKQKKEKNGKNQKAEKVENSEKLQKVLSKKQEEGDDK